MNKSENLELPQKEEDKNTPVKKSLAVFFVIIGCVLMIALVTFACFSWFTNIKEINNHIFVFKTKDGQNADVYINSIKIGQTPLSLTFEDIKNKFNSELNPKTWPPTGIDGSSVDKNGNFSFSILHKSAKVELNVFENILYFQEKQDNVVKTQGALSVMLKAMDGKIGVLSGVGGHSESGIRKQEGEYIKGSQKEETLLFTFETPTNLAE